MLPDGSSVSYSYQGDELSRIAKNGGAKKGEEYAHEVLSFDQRGHALTSRLINGGELTASYNALGACTSLRSAAFSLEVPEGGYDANGNLTALNTKDAIGSLSSTFAYDWLDQLAQEEGVATNCFENDSLNNRRQQNGGYYQVNALNQLLEDPTTHYAYDADGQLIAYDKGGIGHFQEDSNLIARVSLSRVSPTPSDAPSLLPSDASPSLHQDLAAHG